MTVSREVVNKYLTEVKNAIKGDRYRIDMNSNRQANIDLFTNYIIDEADAKQLLLGLEVDDFSEVRQNDHVGYEHEMLFIFGKDVLLTERFGSTEKVVPLYIKFNKQENKYVIVISFHEQKYPLSYCFK